MSTRAERRRADKGQSEDPVRGKVGCRFCRSTVGTYEKRGNHFACKTAGCKGAKTTRQLFEETVRGTLND